MSTTRQRQRFIIQPPTNRFAGATWATNASGYAVNTPSLGSELLTDGGLETWTTATNLTSWAEFVTGTSTVNREATIVNSGTYSMRDDIDASGSSAGIQQAIVAPANSLISVSFSGRASATGKQMRTGIVSPTISGAARNPGTAWGRYVDVYFVSTTNPTIQAQRQAGASASSSLYFDDLSAQIVSLPTTLATIAGTSSNQTAAAKIAALTTGTQAGVGALLDSASNPANGLKGYHDGSTVKLDKLVAGVYTNLISVTVAFSVNAQIEIRRPSGNTFQLWYNGSQRGTDQTVSDAGIINNTLYAMFSTYSANSFSEFSLGGVVIPFRFVG